ncbi:MAG: S41 family peptidase [Bacteroidota bacterium]|nr:S41 family peptidase [Bacteroidota bacterium]
MKKRFSIPLMLTIFVVAFVGGIMVNHVISGDNIYEQLSKFKDVLSLTEKYYVEDVDSQKLTEDAINGLLGNLDPHSVYIKQSQMQRVTEDFQGKFEGIGVEFSVVSDTITVVQPIGGGPSASLGIMANDKIVKIDGKSAIGFTNDQVMKGLKGPKGTKVAVSIVRSGIKDLLEFEIIRDVIPLYSVDASAMLNDKVGYINVTRFAETTNKEMVAALQKLKSQGMKELILDLRLNPGGYLDQAVKMADIFLDASSDGSPRKVVYTKGRRTEFNEEYFAYTNNEFEKLPLIIMLSNGSASASEIVSGAIQDWDRGLIVGETSFGKGLVQRQFPLSDGSALRLTIARYYTPSGRLIQRSYKDGKDKYEVEAFTREEKEGENIEHKESSADSIHPKFKTANGRVILGGGGITPDFIIKPGTLTKYSVALNRRNLFLEFVSHYLSTNGESIKNRYKGNLSEFIKKFDIDEETMNNFVVFTKDKKVEFVQDDFKKDKDFIQSRLKAYIARNYWGNEGWTLSNLPVDTQLEKAMSLFPEAQKIARLN